MWLTAIVLSLTFAGHLIQEGLQEAAEEPILVTMKTVPISQVPFPAITISAENNGINPLGFMEKMMNVMAFYDPKVDQT